MFVKEILKTKPIELYSPYSKGEARNGGWEFPNLRHDIAVRGMGYSASDFAYMNGQRFLKKYQYDGFLTKHVWGRFDQMDWVTFATIPIKPGELPGNGNSVYRIHSVQEVWMLAPMDQQVYHQPRCIILCKHPSGEIMSYAQAPGAIRLLTEEEIKLVHLRDQEAKNRKAALEESLAAVGSSDETAGGPSSCYVRQD